MILILLKRIKGRNMLNRAHRGHDIGYSFTDFSHTGSSLYSPMGSSVPDRKVLEKTA